jgi:hypothetical protein
MFRYFFGVLCPYSPKAIGRKVRGHLRSANRAENGRFRKLADVKPRRARRGKDRPPGGRIKVHRKSSNRIKSLGRRKHEACSLFKKSLHFFLRG